MSNYTKHRIIIHYFGADLKSKPSDFFVIGNYCSIYSFYYDTEDDERFSEPFSGNSWLALQHIITFHKY